MARRWDTSLRKHLLRCWHCHKKTSRNISAIGCAASSSDAITVIAQRSNSLDVDVSMSVSDPGQELVVSGSTRAEAACDTLALPLEMAFEVPKSALTSSDSALSWSVPAPPSVPQQGSSSESVSVSSCFTTHHDMADLYADICLPLTVAIPVAAFRDHVNRHESLGCVSGSASQSLTFTAVQTPRQLSITSFFRHAA